MRMWRGCLKITDSRSCLCMFCCSSAMGLRYASINIVFLTNWKPQMTSDIKMHLQNLSTGDIFSSEERLPWWRDGISHIEMVTHFVPTWSGSWANPGGSVSETGVWSVRYLTTNVFPLEQMDISRKWSEVVQSCLTLCDPMDCSLPGSSIHGIFQARVLEWVASSFSRGFSQPRDWTWISRIVGRHFTVWATRDGNQKNVPMTLNFTFKSMCGWMWPFSFTLSTRFYTWWDIWTYLLLLLLSCYVRAPLEAQW